MSMTIKITRTQFATYVNNLMLRQKLVRTPLNNSQSAYRLKKLLDYLARAGKDLREKYIAEIQNKYAVLDEKGNVVYHEDKKQGFQVKEGMEEELYKAQEDFDAQEFTVIGSHGKPAEKISLLDLAPMTLSVEELVTLEPFLFDAGAVEDSPPESTPVLPEAKVLPMHPAS